MNDCRPQCIDLLELLALLTAKVDYLYLFYRSLSLSDLTDVENCLAPLKNLHLVFNGEVWNAENQKEVTLTVEPLIDSGVAIANITFNGDTTTIYCKDGTRVEVTPKPISGDKMSIADIKIDDGDPITIYSKDFTGVITNIINDITEINNIINNLHPTEVTVLADYATGTKVATITVNNQSTDIKIPTATNVLVNAVDIPNGTTIATITVDGTPTTIKAPSGGGGSNFDVSRIKAGNYITLTYLDLNEQEVQSPLDAYYVKIDANISAIEETISQWERVVANALARHEQAIQELLNA